MEMSLMYRGKGSFINGMTVSSWKSKTSNGNQLAVDTWEAPAQCIIIDQRLGEGSFGEVYRGIVRGDYSNPHLAAYHRQKLHPYVAVKLLKGKLNSCFSDTFYGEVVVSSRHCK